MHARKPYFSKRTWCKSCFSGVKTVLQLGNIFWGVAGVVIVHIAKDLNFFVEQFLDWVNPTLDVVCSVDDDLVEYGGDLFDTLAVAEPSNVGESPCDNALLFEEFVGICHPGVVDEGERDVVHGEEIE